MYTFADLFNMSLSTCESPANWKYSQIILPYKGGDILDSNKYSLILISCSIAQFLLMIQC